MAERLRAAGDWLDVVPGIDSVVVCFDPLAIAPEIARARIDDVIAQGVDTSPADSELLEIPIVYGGERGPDLDELCETTGLSRDEFIALHTGKEYVVDMVGFTPGFAFIGGLDERLRVPRRPVPRERVEPGSVGIADGRTAVYAMASPGGWTLVGRTPCKLFDPDAKEPFVLRAGMRVRFRAIDADEIEQ